MHVYFVGTAALWSAYRKFVVLVREFVAAYLILTYLSFSCVMAK